MKCTLVRGLCLFCSFLIVAVSIVLFSQGNLRIVDYFWLFSIDFLVIRIRSDGGGSEDFDWSESAWGVAQTWTAGWIFLTGLLRFLLTRLCPAGFLRSDSAPGGFAQILIDQTLTPFFFFLLSLARGGCSDCYWSDSALWGFCDQTLPRVVLLRFWLIRLYPWFFCCCCLVFAWGIGSYVSDREAVAQT